MIGNSRVLRLAAISLLAATVWSAQALAEKLTVTFVQTNDIDRMEELDGRGGFARLAALVRDERAKGTTFLVHSGDTLSPSLLSGIDKGAHIIDFLNRLKVDIFTPGNHEFDFGPEVFRARMAEATFPVVTSNVREKDGSQPKNTIDHRIVTVGSVKIGFYGLTTEDTVIVSSPGDIILPALARHRQGRGRGAPQGRRRHRRRRRPHAAHRRHGAGPCPRRRSSCSPAMTSSSWPSSTARPR